MADQNTNFDPPIELPHLLALRGATAFACAITALEELFSDVWHSSDFEEFRARAAQYQLARTRLEELIDRNCSPYPVWA
jgi:hypothetical protein